MGVVYRALDRLNDEIVALKRVTLGELQGHQPGTGNQQLASELRLALAHEFQILSGLRHPNIISVLDYGFDQDQPFFTMRYLPGATTLCQAARDRSPTYIAALLQQLLQGLAYLHRRGILHRDLKPGNVLVADGKVRILDFGLSASEQRSDRSAGTPFYAAPELYEGRPHSRAADLFAAGILFYEALAGSHPFAPFDHSYVDRLLEEEPAWEPIPDSLRPVLERLLARQPDGRYRNALEAQAALAAALGHPLPPETAEIRDSYVQAARFVGREAELEQLTAALDQAAAGQGSAWLIGGESGVGKSRLLEELRTRALVAGFQVLYGQTVETGGLPYQAWRAPLRQLLVDSDEVDDLTAGILLPLVDDIEQLLQRPVASAPELPEAAARTRLLTTIARLFWQANRPVLLLLEGLHLAEGSLAPIPYLIRPIQQQRLLVVGSFRSDETPNLPAQLPDMHHLPLQRLSNSDMAALSAAMLGAAGRDEALLALLQRESEGNAFFAVEVVRALADGAGQLGEIGNAPLPQSVLPNGIRDIVDQRLRRLPAWARRLLEKAAVAGREVELPLLATLAPDVDVENEWLPRCADAAVLDLRNGIWQFSHGKIRDGVLAGLPPERIRKLHAGVARAIESQFPGDARAVQLVYHWHEADESEKERHYAAIAGRQAAEQHTLQEALRFFRRALALTPASESETRYTLYQHCLDARAFLGNRDEIAGILNEMDALADVLDDDSRRIDVRHRRGSWLSEAGKHDEAIENLAAARQLARRSGLKQKEARVLLAWAGALSIQRKLEEAQSKIAASRALAKEIDDALGEALADEIMGILLYNAGEVERSLSHFEAGLRGFRQHGSPARVHRALLNMSLSQEALGLSTAAEETLAQSLTISRQRGDVINEALTLNNLGLYYGQRGRYDESFQLLEQATALTLQVGLMNTHSYVLNNLGLAYWNSGAREQAREYLQRAIAAKQKLNAPWSEAYTWNLLGHLTLESGADAEALVIYRRAERLQAAVSTTLVLVETWAGIAAAEARLGNLPTARDYGARVWAHVQGKGWRGEWQWAVSALHLHEAFRRDGDPRAAAIITLAHAELQARATGIAGGERRAVFLNRVPTHRRIRELFQVENNAEPPVIV